MPEIDPKEGLRLLSEATSDSFSELMSRTPLKHSDADIANIVSNYRELRARWAVAELAGKKSLPKVTADKVQKKIAGPAAPKAKDMEF